MGNVVADDAGKERRLLNEEGNRNEFISINVQVWLLRGFRRVASADVWVFFLVEKSQRLHWWKEMFTLLAELVLTFVTFFSASHRFGLFFIPTGYKSACEIKDLLVLGARWDSAFSPILLHSSTEPSLITQRQHCHTGSVFSCPETVAFMSCI